MMQLESGPRRRRSFVGRAGRAGVVLAMLVSMVAFAARPARAIDVAWTQIAAPGTVADVAVGPGGEVYITLTDNRAFRWNGNGFDPIDGAAKLLAPGPNGVLWRIDPEGLGWRREGNRWDRLWLVDGVTDIAMGANGAIHYTEQRGNVYQIEADANTQFSRRQPPDVNRVAVAPDGMPWLVKRDNSILVPVGQWYRTMPGQAQDVGIGANGAVWITGVDDSIWWFTGLGWDRAPGAARWVSVGPDGTPWVVNRDGNLYRGAAVGANAPAPLPGPAPFPTPATVTSRPVVALLCKAADTAEEPRTTAQVQQMLTGAGGLNDYIKEQSLGAMNLDGSRVHGWYQMAGAAASYGRGNAERIANDCGAAAADVTFPDNAFVGFFTNVETTPGTAFTWTRERNGARQNLSAMVFTKEGVVSPALVAHEMGHLLGMGHHDLGWDPLGGAPLGILEREDPMGTMGPGYHAYHRDKAGWIPAGRKFSYAGTQQQITLTRLTLPTTNDFLMAQIPMATGPGFYTVELRTWAGSDGHGRPPSEENVIKAEGVLIQRIDPQGTDFDSVVMPATPVQLNQEPGALWRQGMTFRDEAANVTVRVDEVDVLRGTARLTIAPINAAAPPPPPPPPAMMPPAMMPPVMTPVTPPATNGQPADNLANAGQVAAPVTLTADTNNAGNEAGEPQPCGNIGKTMWLRFTAGASGTYAVDTEGSGYDTVLAVYRSNGAAAGFDALTLIDCNDDTGATRQSRVAFEATAGQTIYIQVGGYAGEGGNARIRLTAP